MYVETTADKRKKLAVCRRLGGTQTRSEALEVDSNHIYVYVYVKPYIYVIYTGREF